MLTHGCGRTDILTEPVKRDTVGGATAITNCLCRKARSTESDWSTGKQADFVADFHSFGGRGIRPSRPASPTLSWVEAGSRSSEVRPGEEILNEAHVGGLKARSVAPAQ